MVQGAAFADSNVDHLAGDARRLAGTQDRVHDVRDVSEVARLFAVTEDGGSRSAQIGHDELRQHTRVRRMRVLARAEDVEKPQRHGFQVEELCKDTAIVLTGQFRERVGRKRARLLRLDSRQNRAVTVDGRRRREDQPLGASLTSGHQYVERPSDVDVV